MMVLVMLGIMLAAHAVLTGLKRANLSLEGPIAGLDSFLHTAALQQ